MTITLHEAECLDVLRGMPDASVDSVVTDPPYGLSQHHPKDVAACIRAWLKGEEFKPGKKGYLGHAWDAWVPGPEVWREVRRVLKPGGHLLAFAGTRSMDLMTMAIRLGGMELRDNIGFAHDGAPLLAWVYSSGMPKGYDTAQCIEKRLTIGSDRRPDRDLGGQRRYRFSGSQSGGITDTGGKVPLTTPEALRWEGWGSTLKPAWEPIIMARRPLDGTVAENVVRHGTGGLNIEATRIATGENLNGGAYSGGDKRKEDASSFYLGTQAGAYTQPTGRFPANVVHDGSKAVIAAFDLAGERPSATTTTKRASGTNSIYGHFNSPDADNSVPNYGDTGSAARFFFSPKASKEDRAGSKHPTVKPVELMRYLVTLVTPPGGTILDPFAGSGTTGQAATEAGFHAILIEREAEYAADIRRRLGLGAA
jgi:site-specific DNA-methyltransferase (adenine-specific)